MKFSARVVLLVTGLLLGIIAASLVNLLTTEPKGSQIVLLPPPSPSPIRVHVTGAVAESGVYLLPPGSIIEDAIQAAGGSLPDADLSSINLAAPILDGQQINIASHHESLSTPDNSVSTISTPSLKMNINTAKAPELEDLPGIGPSLAQAIIEYRQKNGPFSSIEDLLNVPGIGPAKLEQIKDLVVIR